ncbi:MAG: arylformamidase [Bacillota bacterium]|uniref:Kynurenine formamidase n=1 Tax=Virgibacillus salarius TaxID=447199 RepID=A0A941IAC6_9BACI|nr:MULTISPECIES: arylformamidase [Bacillaceae]NAZ07927.1 arylformamidase [Agaribacter marinus]MBR7795211.1 arylformamidase [Virgibacillus salarius]MCC2251992.1 arylformamidase [Virgibacillus sp. AGTR]QRZ19925.1 arylformamidase [Virgibacillus sp. AGTR]WBX80393.1 arylformamidase [Virgibacillus salarius]
MGEWIDISQPLTDKIAHWPGDKPFSYSLTASKQETKSVNIGQITTSLHTGTHIDAPFHFDSNGKTIEQLDINLYIGKSVVIDVSQANTITAEVLSQYHWPSEINRVLLRTSLPNNPERFPDVLPNLDPNIAPYLQRLGVFLLGVDMPSVDAPDSKDLVTHHALQDHGIHILENIMLDQIKPGEYELIALPLHIHGADGSPVRAALCPINKEDAQHDK